MTKRVSFIVILVLLFAAPLYLRAVVAARAELAQARDARAHGAADEATRRYAAAIAWRAPFNSAAYTAAEELIDWAAELSDTEQRVYALRKARSAFRSSGSFLPDSRADDLTRQIEAALQDLQALAPLRIYETVPAHAHYGWQFGALLMFGVWVTAALLLAFRGFDVDGQMRPQPARSYALILLLGYLAWLACLRVA